MIFGLVPSQSWVSPVLNRTRSLLWFLTCLWCDAGNQWRGWNRLMWSGLLVFVKSRAAEGVKLWTQRITIIWSRRYESVNECNLFFRLSETSCPHICCMSWLLWIRGSAERPLQTFTPAVTLSLLPVCLLQSKVISPLQRTHRPSNDFLYDQFSSPAARSTTCSPQHDQSELPSDPPHGKLVIMVEDFYYGCTPGRSSFKPNALDQKFTGPYRCIHCPKTLCNNIRWDTHTHTCTAATCAPAGQHHKHIMELVVIFVLFLASVNISFSFIELFMTK